MEVNKALDCMTESGELAKDQARRHTTSGGMAK
jgi:hypothetical protein